MGVVLAISESIDWPAVHRIGGAGQHQLADLPGEMRCIHQGHPAALAQADEIDAHPPPRWSTTTFSSAR